MQKSPGILQFSFIIFQAKVIALSVNGEKHEAVRYPYKALPDDLLQRLQEHFTVHQVANLSPQTVEQNAAIFAEAEGLLGSNENVDAALLEKMPKLRATSTISVGYDNFDVDALTAEKFC